MVRTRTLASVVAAIAFAGGAVAPAPRVRRAITAGATLRARVLARSVRGASCRCLVCDEAQVPGRA